MDKELFEKIMHDFGGHIVNLRLFSELVEEGVETLSNENFFSIIKPFLIDFDIIRYYTGHFYDTSNFTSTIQSYATSRQCNILFHNFKTCFTRANVSIICNFVIFLIKTFSILEIEITNTSNGISILAKNCNIGDIYEYINTNIYIKLLMDLNPQITQKTIENDSNIIFYIPESF